MFVASFGHISHLTISAHWVMVVVDSLQVGVKVQPWSYEGEIFKNIVISDLIVI
jgi:hypothetical protein